MVLKDIVVTDKDGNKVPAKLATCTNCGATVFQVFILGKNNHQHLQCDFCQVTFCDGSCAT